MPLTPPTTMATTLIQVQNCGSLAFNVGDKGCLEFKRPNGALLLPYNLTWTAAQIADLRNTIKTAMQTDDPTQRVKLMGNFPEFTDKSSDAIRQEFQDKSSEKIMDGKFVWDFAHRLGPCVHQKYRKFGGKAQFFKVVFFDDSNTLLFTKTTDTTGNVVVTGLTLNDISVDNWKASDGSKATMYPVQFSMIDPTEVLDRSQMVAAGFSVLGELSKYNMADINLAVSSPLTTGNVTLEATLSCNGAYVPAVFPTQFATPTAWKAVNAATSASLTITSVTATSTGYTIAISTATGYPATGGQVLLSMAAPSILGGSPINVPGYESNVLTLTV